MPRRAPSAVTPPPPPPKRTRGSRRKARRVAEASEPIVWLNEIENPSAMCGAQFYEVETLNRPWMEVGTRQSED